MTGYIDFIGFAARVSIPFVPEASASLSSERTSFYTDEPVDFEDFQNSSVLVKTLEIVPLFGYTFSYLTFLGEVEGSPEIYISSWSVRMPNLSESAVAGSNGLIPWWTFLR